MIEIYTDGCRKKNGDGGYAAIVVTPFYCKLIAGWSKSTTNNKMELKGPVEALDHLTSEDFEGEVQLTCDSKYVVQGFNHWMDGWKKKGWKLSAGAPVKNLDFWMRLHEFRFSKESKLHIKFQWVRGHNGHQLNELCDTMANHACKNRHNISQEFFHLHELVNYANTL